MTSSHVLVVHPESALRQMVTTSLDREQIRVSHASNDAEGLAILEQERVHVLVTGSALFGGDAFIRRAATIQPLLGLVLVAESASAEPAMQDSPSGVIQCLRKPVTLESLRSAVAKAMARQVRQLLGPSAPGPQRPAPAQPGADARAAGDRIVAASRAMREILTLVRKCAPTDAAILICGEPDTGRQRIAREIHSQSRRAAGPFVRVACGTLGESELRDGLVGHGEKSAACDGPAALPLLEAARGGTLFLEDVSQLPLWAQIKLLDALQQSQTRGSDDPCADGIDVRVIASTTVDLAGAAARQTFLPRLYYYLNVVQLHVPPLRHRPQDLRALAEAHLSAANAMRTRYGGKQPCYLSDDGLRCLVEYDWPGNILQLASVISHSVLLAEGEEIGRPTLVEALGEVNPRGESDSISVPLAGGLKEIERAVIEAVIVRCRGNKTAAARLLKLHRRTLYRILQEETHSAAGGAPLPLVAGLGLGAEATVSV